MRYSKKELLIRSAEVKKSADELINSKGFDKLFSQFGSILYTGSYASNLMVWNDIDMQISLDNDAERVEEFTKISSFFLHDTDVKNIKLINFKKGKKKGMPSGMYMGVNYSLKDGVKWKVDIWSLNPEDKKRSIQFSESIDSKMSEEHRLLVLEWKFRLMGESSRVPQMASYLLYQGIILKGLTSEREIINFLEKNGVYL